MKYSLKEIAEICSGTLSGCNVTVDSVTVDSRHSLGRETAPLFAAICGINHDGHHFIGDLYRRGVRGFLIEEAIDETLYPEAGFVRTDRTLHALQALAANYRRSFRGTICAITGSNGKTTVKEWTAQLIGLTVPEIGEKLFRSPRSFNSQLGVPLSILMMRGDEKVALIEAGISRPGEMEHLAEIVKPDIGVFTRLGEEHAENFSSEEQKAAEKARLFRDCRIIVYDSRCPNVEDAIRREAPEARLIDAAQYREGIAPSIDPSLCDSAALSVALCEAIGIPSQKTIPQLTMLQQVNLQLDIREGIADSIIISDNYNTDINSLSMTIDYLKSVAGERPCTLILSDMPFSPLPDEKLYRTMAQIVLEAGIDRTIGIGDDIRRYGRFFGPEAEFYATVEEFLSTLTQESLSKRAVLIKGNLSARFGRITHALQRKSHTTVLEIDLDAMIHNLNIHRAMLNPQTKMVAMVKASSYGNGDFEVADMLCRQGVDYLAVAFADEGVTLRDKGITMPVVVLNADSDSFELMIANRLEPEIYSFNSLLAFIQAVNGTTESAYPIHIKLDTGMHRLGFEEPDMEELIRTLRANGQSVVVRSIFSHLATADIPEEDAFTRQQIALYDKLSCRLMEGLPYRPIRHLANSAAIERFPEAEYDMCRLGIGLYGFSPFIGDRLRPVSRLTTRIVQIKELAPGQTVGYGRKGVITRPTRTATIPIGYADGLNRHLGCGRWAMLVNGKPAPIIGRICMDSCMIDISGIDAREGDPVIVFGGGPGNGADDMASILDTIPYEVMTSISGRVKRIYIKE